MMLRRRESRSRLVVMAFRAGPTSIPFFQPDGSEHIDRGSKSIHSFDGDSRIQTEGRPRDALFTVEARVAFFDGEEVQTQKKQAVQMRAVKMRAGLASSGQVGGFQSLDNGR